MGHGWTSGAHTPAHHRRFVCAALTIALTIAGISLATAQANAGSAGRGIAYEGAGSERAEAYTTGGKWPSPNVTYRIASDTNNISRAAEHAAFRQAFDLWQNASSLRFTEVSTGGDIIITFGQIDGAYGILGQTYYPTNGDMEYDIAETWTDQVRNSTGQPVDLVTVAAHEIGHTIGLGHSNASGALMGPYYYSSHRYLSQDDIDGVRSLYPCSGSCGGGTTTTTIQSTTTTTKATTTTTTVAPVGPKFSIGDLTVNEPVDGSVAAKFTVTLSASTGLKTSVVYETTDGTAVAGSDYRHVRRTVKFNPGQTSKTIIVSIRSDKVKEPTEQFSVVLSRAKNAGIADGTAIGTILDRN